MSRNTHVRRGREALIRRRRGALSRRNDDLAKYEKQLTGKLSDEDRAQLQKKLERTKQDVESLT